MADITSYLIGGAGLAVALITLLFTGEWERVHGFFAIFKFGKRDPDVVVGVVKNGNLVLLVHRKPAKGSALFWQFPSGNVRRGEKGEDVVLREIRNETSIDAKVSIEIGNRNHPYTGKRCTYFGCDWVAGTPANLDLNENIDARWVDKKDVEAYIPRGLFRPAESIWQGDCFEF